MGAIKKYIATKTFGRVYIAISLGALLATTILWSFLGAQLHQSNADQLVDAYMVSDPGTFAGAIFPGAHSFLLKWPVFALISFFGATPTVFLVATIALTLVTVGVLALVLFKIERRPLLFGTVCLLLASALLLVPAQPYPGALLPVNMAMITTRNLEYVLYLVSLILLVHAPHMKSWRFWSAVACLSIVGATDKLFFVLSAGGAIGALFVYALARQWTVVQLAARWLVASLAAILLATMLLLAVDGNLTHLLQATNISPYEPAHNITEPIKAAAYAVVGIVTNFGANLAFDVTNFKEMPGRALAHVFSFGGLALLLNVATVIGGMWATCWVVMTSLRHRAKQKKPDASAQLALMLVASSVVAIAAFMVSVHYYAVDARYLAISFFAVFVAGTAWLRSKKLPSVAVVGCGVVAIAAMSLAVPAVLQAQHTASSALSTLDARNMLVAKALKERPTDALLGDYWRVVPTKLLNNKINILPMSSCTTLQNVQTSGSWQVDLHTHSFAYLLTLERSGTGYEACSVDQIVAAYGKPNSSTLIAGTLAAPSELLLFYDKGINKSAPVTLSSNTQVSTILPIPVDELPHVSCVNPTDINIVAHQDDDLLFMNPDIMHAIKAGRCQRTIYVTAGDAGSDSFYWLSREHGARAAYSKMIGGHDNEAWIERIVQLSENHFVTVANPQGNSNISLIFLHLPDGNPQGSGFWASHHESLEKLLGNRIDQIHSVDHQSFYSADELTDAVASLMKIYQPALIRTQSTFRGNQFTDHSDHMAVGLLAQQALETYEQRQFEGHADLPLLHYMGYPIHEHPENVSGDDYKDKSTAFYTYSNHDDSTCHTEEQCDTKAVYGIYLRRQYTNDY